MKLKDFDFYLPEHCIARFPTEKRDHSRLMMVNRKTRSISHHLFNDIITLTSDHDFFVTNNSRVIPAKFFGRINDKNVEMLVVHSINPYQVEALTLPAKKFLPNVKIYFDNDPDLVAEVISMGQRGRRILSFNKPFASITQTGYAPLPPYIKRKFPEASRFRALDLERYQTVYAQVPGSIAAPTAGLHFTPGLLEQIKKRSEIIEITLSVGEATFQKITAEDINDHHMDLETITISFNERLRIQELKKNRPLIAVGTTSVRSLESLAILQPQQETFSSGLFISPGFQFRLVDKLITNFHLPQSSLFILVCAFAGIDLMKEAYQIAIAQRYRFFSYGDAMLIV